MTPCYTARRFNREGDLFISCAKDYSPNLWYSDDGVRVGSYKGHNGTVWTCDITCEARSLFAERAGVSDFELPSCVHMGNFPVRGRCERPCGCTSRK